MGQKETEQISAGMNRIMIYGPKTDGTYIIEFKMAAGEALAIKCAGWRDPRAKAFPGAHALWAIRAGRLLRNSLFFSVFALHVAAFGDVPTESSRGEKSCDAGK